MPSTLPIASATVPGIGAKVFVITMKSAPTLRSIVALALLVTEEPRTPPAATSASPTMSADAVAAVRRGLRRAFSRESRPVVPQIRGSGRPMAATAGRLANGLSPATPRKTRSAPMPTQRMPASASRPAAMLAMPRPRTATPTRARRRRDDSGRATSSRRAAIGGILVARRAGPIAATTVTTMPTRKAHITVLACRIRPLAGMSPMKALMTARRPMDSSTPRPRPRIEPSRPTAAASAMTEPFT